MKHIKKPLIAIVWIFLCAAAAWTQTSEEQPHTFLQKYFGFSKEELASIDRGRIVTKLPKASDAREVAVLGVVRLNVSGEVFLEKFMDIETFKKSELVLRIRKFSNPPRQEDVSELTLDIEHLSGLKNCKVGECNVKIPAALIERLHKKVNWRAADYEQLATAETRRFLLDYVQAYLKDGNSSLVEFSDRPYEQRLADEVRSMLDQSPYLLKTAPEFHRYLGEFPKMQLTGVDNFVYWSKEKVRGFKPVLSLTHVTVYKRSDQNPFKIIIASKQIYANHYFEGSLALTWLIDVNDSSPENPGCYLIYLNRSRMDAWRGDFSWLKRFVALGQIRAGLMKSLQLTRERVEHPADQP
jgi:hypothetical protein